MNKRRYFKNMRKQYKAFILLAFILSLAKPLLTLINSPIGLNGADSSIFRTDMAKSFLTELYAPAYFGGLLMVFAFIAPFIVFSYLYDKPSLDNYFSMPTRRKDLFLSQYFFALVMMVVLPVLLGYLCESLVTLGLVNQLAPHLTYSIPKLVIMGVLIVIGGFILTIPSVISILCTTTLFNGIIYAFVFRAFLPLLAGFLAKVQGNSLGRIFEPEVTENPIFKISYQTIHMNIFSGINQIEELWVPILVWLAISLVLFYFARKLYEKRKVDRVKTRFVFKGFYPATIFIFGCLVLTMALYFSIFFGKVYEPDFLINQSSALLFIFIVGFVVFLVVELIRFQGRPPILKGLGFYLLIFVLSGSLAYGLAGPWREANSLATPSSNRIASVKLYNPVNENSEYMMIVDQGLDVFEIKDSDEESMNEFLSPCTLEALNSGKKDDQGEPVLKNRNQLDHPPKHGDKKPLTAHLGPETESHYYQVTEVKNPEDIQAVLAFQKDWVSTWLDLEKKESQHIQTQGMVTSPITGMNLPPARFEGPAQVEGPGEMGCNRSVVLSIEYLDKKGKTLDRRAFRLNGLNEGEDGLSREKTKKGLKMMEKYFNGKVYLEEGMAYKES